MSNTITTTAAPTDRQAMLIKMASSKHGATRVQVRDALGYGERAAIPVQAMLKQVAERFGFEMWTSYGDGKNTREAFYHFKRPTPVAKRVAKRAATKTTKAARKAA